MKYQDKSRLQHALPTPFYDNFPKQSFLPLATYFSRNRSKFSPHEEFFRLPWKITFPHISIIYLHQFVMITIARWLERENMKISLVQYRRKLKTYNQKKFHRKKQFGVPENVLIFQERRWWFEFSIFCEFWRRKALKCFTSSIRRLPVNFRVYATRESLKWPLMP